MMDQRLKSKLANEMEAQSMIWKKFCRETGQSKKKVAKKDGRIFKPHPNNVHSDSDMSNFNFIIPPSKTGNPTSSSESSENVVEKSENAIESNNNEITKNEEICDYDYSCDIDGNEAYETYTKTILAPNVAKNVERKAKNSARDNYITNKKADTPKESPSKPPRPQRNNFVNIEQKLKSAVHKICLLLEDLSQEIVRGIDPSVGDEDYERRKKRALEFSSRFSRNYLYPIGRDIDECQRLSAGNKNKIFISMHQKLVSSHQTVLQALQALKSHLPSTFMQIMTGKIREMLDLCMKLCEVHRQSLKMEQTAVQSRREIMINSFQIRIKQFSQKLNDTIVSLESNVISKSNSRLLGSNVRLDKSKGRRNKPLKSKLSMYSEPPCFNKDHIWKLTAQTLARKRFNVPSRYKTAQFKHRPPAGKPHFVDMPEKNKLFHKRSSGLISHSAVEDRLPEEEIETMVGLEEDGRDTVRKDVSEVDVVVPKEKSEGKQENEKQDVSQDARLGDAICGILRMVQEDAGPEKRKELARILEAVLPEDIAQKLGSAEGAKEEKEQSKRKWTTINEVGEKNARLICIRDDRSLSELVDEDNKELKIVEKENRTGPTWDETGTNKQAQSQDILVINRVSSSSSTKQLKLLPKDFAFNIIKYKLEFNKHTKGNHMYRKSSAIKPWLFLGKIADQLLGQLLSSVVSEINVNDLCEMLYQSEFE